MQIAKEHIRQNILNAALPLFYAKGYSKVTIREIADDSHVGLSNIYNYYNSKEDIFRELVQPVINDFEIMLDKHHGNVYRPLSPGCHSRIHIVNQKIS